MSTLPPPSADLIERLALMAGEFNAASIRPGGAHVARFGSAICTANPELPDLDFHNRIAGLTPAGVALVPAIVAFYDRMRIRPWAELVPAEGFEHLAAVLRAHGFAQTGFHAMLYGLAEPPSASAVEVREVTEPGDLFDAFVEGRARGLEIPEEHRAGAIEASRHWIEMPDWRLYVALVDGRPAGMAVLTIDGGVGYLANAATVPELRGRGAQSALIACRVADAAAAGCELVASGCTPGGRSHRNLHRGGLRVACTMAVWRRV